MTLSHIKKLGRNLILETMLSNRRRRKHFGMAEVAMANMLIGRPSEFRALERHYGNRARFPICGWRDAYRCRMRASGRDPDSVGTFVDVGVRSKTPFWPKKGSSEAGR